MCNESQLVTLAPRVPESEDDGLQELVPDVEEHGDEDAGDANHLEVAMSGNREETYSTGCIITVITVLSLSGPSEISFGRRRPRP